MLATITTYSGRPDSEGGVTPPISRYRDESERRR